MAGRPPKPTHLKILEGEKNQDRINRDEPMPNDASLTPPITLSDLGLQIWNQHAPDMKAKGILTEWDAQALAMACDNMAKYWYYGELLEAHRDDFPECGPYLCRGGSGGVIKSPYHQYQKDCLAMALQIFSRFGMTPADRSKLSVKDENGHVGGLDELIS